ncbi:hypothetical protein Tco_0053254 [Tanacetum coccineum]
MCPRPLRPISKQANSGYRPPRWSQINSTSWISSCFQIPHANSPKTISIAEITSIKTEETISKPRSRIIDSGSFNSSNSTCSSARTCPQTHGCVKNRFLKDMVTCQCCSVEEHAKPRCRGDKGHDAACLIYGSTEKTSTSCCSNQTRNLGVLIVTLVVTPVPKCINVYGGEITLRVGKEAITFNLDQTSKYTADYDHMTANKIDVIEMDCDEYLKVIALFNGIEAELFLALEDGPTSSEVDPIISLGWMLVQCTAFREDSFISCHVKMPSGILTTLPSCISLPKKDAKASSLRWFLLAQEFDMKFETKRS